MYMKSVGIKVLKDNLSKYLKLVRGGETILATDRDEVIAEIRQPARHVPGGRSRFEAFLDEEARRGSVVRAKKGATSSWSMLRNIPRPRVPVDVQALLDETRAD
jgi:antitoxin (DNA-binding transcriptional repressor) of toxin-antitoxin stability system